MDIIIRNIAAISASILLAALTASCSNPDYTREIKIDGLKGIFRIVEGDVAIPLTGNSHRIEYISGSEDIFVFEGNSGSYPEMTVDYDNNILIIAYCGGAIEHIDSAFFNAEPPPVSPELELYRTQVISNPGFSYKGREICAESDAAAEADTTAKAP